MKDRSARRRAVMALAITSLLIAACGEDGDEEAAGATTLAAGTAPDIAAPDNTAPDSTAPHSAAPDTAAPDNTAPDNTAPDNTAPDNTVPDAGDELCTEDRVGGEVTMGAFIEPPGLDPILIGAERDVTELAVIFDVLVRHDLETGTFVPQMAESLEPNDDFTEWTLTLREGVAFGNGDPLTAQAVQASIARHQDPASQSRSYVQALEITDMEVVDPRTLVLRVRAPWAGFPSLLAGPVGMITNAAVVEARGADFATDPTGGGVGPYELERYAPGEELVVRAKDDYWGGPVCIEHLRFITVSGAEATYDTFKTGEIQLAYINKGKVIKQARDDGAEGVSAFFSGHRLLLLNHVSGPTADPLVRQALAAAIDPEVTDERAEEGEGRPTTAIIYEGSVHYRGLEGPQPDAARAADLVEEARANGWDGNITLLGSNSPETEEIALTVKALADAAGMNVTVELIPISDLVPRVRTDRNFEMVIFGLGLTDAEPWLALSNYLDSESTLNSGGYANPEMDAALDSLRAAPGEEARTAALADIQEIWNEDIPNIIFGASEEFIAIDESVKGVKQTINANILFDDAYLDD